MEQQELFDKDNNTPSFSSGFIPECPFCNERLNIVCAECGSWQESCDCPFDSECHDLYCLTCHNPFIHIGNCDEEESDDFEMSEMTTETNTSPQCNCNPSNKYFCGICRVHRSSEDAPWNEFSSPAVKAVKTTTASNTPKTNVPTYHGKCRHYGVSVDLGNGVLMWPSSMNNGRNSGGGQQDKPDFGLYADYGWRATWRNEYINWPDFQIPVDLDMACTQIEDAYMLAKQGKYVEIGCIGGHGRTGTILACMYVYASWDSDSPTKITPQEAVKKVHTDYCHEAVESKTQEWFVEYFSNKFFNTELPEKPATTNYSQFGSLASPHKSSTGGCSLASHYAMYLRGHDECYDKGKKCTWWQKDIDVINSKDSSKQFTKYTEETALKQLADYPLRDGGIKLSDDEKPEQTYLVCTQTEHYAMVLRGWETCSVNGKECQHWNQDTHDFSNGNFSGVNKNILQKLVDKTANPKGAFPKLKLNEALLNSLPEVN